LFAMDPMETRRLVREEAWAQAQAEIDAMKAELRARAEAVGRGERELLDALAEARRLAVEVASEKALAAAERERLDEREQQIRAVEKELAARRMELEARSDQAVGFEAGLAELA